MTRSRLFASPLFLAGLLVRLALIFTVVPRAAAMWYVPFMDATATSLSLDPWAVAVGHGVAEFAFPYGFGMWLAFLPATWICLLLHIPVHFGYGFTLLSVDLALLLALKRWLPDNDRILLGSYWLSPIVIVATYWLGLNDLIPSLMLCLALYYMRQLRLLVAGVFCGAAIAAKASMVMALPFFLIYLHHHRPLRQHLHSYARGLILSLVVLGSPLLASYVGLHMLLDNPEIHKVYQMAIPVGDGIGIYVLPLAYMVMLYMAWRMNRLNFDMFLSLIAVVFLLVVLLVPASPGWFIWVMPLLVMYQLRHRQQAYLLVTIFSMLYLVVYVFGLPRPGLINEQLWAVTPPAWWTNTTLSHHMVSLLKTAMAATGLVLVASIGRQTIRHSDYFRLTRRPLVIGIAGDSGAGKDTLVDGLVGLFGQHSVSRLSGDDYHLWDRQRPMWQVMTHLNPLANDLDRYASDLRALVSGRAIMTRHYDHETGKMSRPFRLPSNDVIIASGLHALYLPVLRDCYDLKIFLAIDENLRKYFKIQRDVHKRGHTLERVLTSIDKREPDAAQFVRPQAEHADLVMSLQPIHPRMLDKPDDDTPMRFKLHVLTRNGMSGQALNRVLLGICGLHIDMTERQDELEMTIEGDVSSEDIALAARVLCPGMLEFLDLDPAWLPGAIGLMQLIALTHIHQALNKRLIK